MAVRRIIAWEGKVSADGMEWMGGAASGGPSSNSDQLACVAPLNSQMNVPAWDA